MTNPAVHWPTGLVGLHVLASFFVPVRSNGGQISPVGEISKNNVSVSTVVRKGLVDEIDRRRKLLNDTSRSEFVKLILEHWFSKGCPAVNEPDRMMLVATGKTR